MKGFGGAEFTNTMQRASKMRCLRHSLAPALAAVALIALATWKIRQSAEAKRPVYLEARVEDLAAIKFPKDGGTTGDIPANIREFDGKQVRLFGYVWRPWKTIDFHLIANAYERPFRPRIQDQVLVRMPQRTSISNVPPDRSEVYVDGVIHVGPQEFGTFGTGHVESIYQIDANTITIIPPSPPPQPRRITVWCIGIVTFGLAVGGLYARRRWVNQRQTLRRLNGLCQRCGYDLRAGHINCPECGHPCHRKILRGQPGRVRIADHAFTQTPPAAT